MTRQLEHLSLKGNFLTRLNSEYAFSGLHFNLKRLNLASNKIEFIARRVFMHASKLRELNLEKNELGRHFDVLSSDGSSDINTVFEGIESELKFLNLEHNNLKPAHLTSLSNLLNIESLRLGHNNFASLNLKANSKKSTDSSLFEFYRNLTYLDMQNSSLSQMPYYIGLNRTLLSFNLAANQLCHINAKNLDKLYSQLRHFNLNSNPLLCDCNLADLRQWLNYLGEKNQKQKEDFLSFDQQQQQLQREPTVNWKCQAPNTLANKKFNLVNIENFICQISSNNNNNCVYDQDKDQQVPELVKTTEIIKIVESNTIMPATYFFLTNQPTTQLKTKSVFTELMTMSFVTSPTDAETKKFQNQKRQQTPENSFTFLSSAELKQTLMGSFIGALFVVVLVAMLTLLIQASRKKWHLTSGSTTSTTSDHDHDNKDKSANTTANTTSAISPYDIGKLTLQTLCGNSNNNNSSCSSSSSSTCSGDTTQTCACNVLEKGFTKMDPLRLTMCHQQQQQTLTSNRNSTTATFHRQNYLNCHLINAATLNPHFQYQIANNNNLHYLSSHLPCSSPTETLSISDLNGHSGSNNMNDSCCTTANNYDKLHQQLQRLNNSSSSSFRPPLTNNSYQTGGRLFDLNGINCGNCNTLNGGGASAAAVGVAETTPFLILTNGDVNRLINESNSSNSNNNNNQVALNQSQDQQHTYHEIGDVLMNLNNRQANLFENKNKINGMYI